MANLSDLRKELDDPQRPLSGIVRDIVDILLTAIGQDQKKGKKQE